MAITYQELNLIINKRLAAAGIEAHRLETKEILCAAAGKTREKLLQDMNLYTTDEIAERAEAMTVRREAGEPIAYIIGEWSFCGLDFTVNAHGLIPRIDTEMLANIAVDRLKKETGNLRVLDLCAGTGCVGITVADRLKNARVVLMDLSDGALDLCKKNIRRNNLTSRVVHMRGDALQAPNHALGQFDMLVSNPPYIPSGDIPGLDSSVKDYEPLMALDGGADGLDFYRAITKLWMPALKPGGHLIYEVGIGQSEKVAMMLVRAGFESIRITRDTGGIDRVVEGRRPKEREIPELLHERTEEEEG